MFRHHALATFLCLCGFSQPVVGAPPKDSEQVTLAVVPATSSLYAGDPLLIKVVLKNHGKTPVTLPNGFDAEGNGIRLEVRKPGGDEFGRAEMIGEGLYCGPPQKVEVPAGTSLVVYERGFWNGPPRFGPVFSEQGKWQIRVSARVGKETVTTEPVTVSVAEPPQRLAKGLSDHVPSIGQALTGTLPTEEEARAMREARDVLAGSNAAQAIRQAEVLRELRGAGSPKARQLAFAALQQHRAGLTPVAREHFDLLTAEVLFHRKEYKEALKIVEALPDPSAKRDWLRHVGAHFLSEAGK